MSATKTIAVKPLTKQTCGVPSRSWKPAKAEHERLWYSNRDARFRMDTRFAYESLQEKYEIAMNTLRYAAIASVVWP